MTKVLNESGEISFSKFSGHIIHLGLERFRQRIHMIREIGGEYDNLYKFIYLRIIKIVEVIPSKKFVYGDHVLVIYILNLKNYNKYIFIYRNDGKNIESELKGPDDEYKCAIPDFVRLKILWDIKKAKKFYTFYYANLWEVRKNE